MIKKTHSLLRLTAALSAFALLVATAQAALSEKLRVLSCDLAALPVHQTSAGAELKALLDKADPDLVFLQGATDWASCDRICKMRPGLRVLTCSLFSTTNAGQVAILARDKAVLSWVEPISGADGFAFAVIQAGARKIGVFSVQSRDASASATRVLAEVSKLRQFDNNRPDSFIVAGSSLLAATLTQAGFETMTADSQSKAATSPELWNSNAGFLSRPRAIVIPGLPRSAIVADVDTANPFATKFAYQNALLFPGESPAPIQAVIQPAPAPQKPFPIGITLAIVGATIIILFLVAPRRRNSMALVPIEGPNLPSDSGQLSDPVRQGLLAWVKTIFMQRLLADRRQMIAEQNDATRRTLAIEQKLTELQISLQDRISGYEGRIARLEGELSAATLENRELIRHQINDLKEKVAKAKEQFVYDRN